MQFRLLIDVEVVDFLQTLPAGRRQRVLGHYSDFIEQDDLGRRLDVSLIDGLAVFYWTDVADRQVKILKVTMAD